MAFDKIIALDDELIIRKSLEEHFRKKRYTVAGAQTLQQAKQLIAKDNFDLIFADVRLPDGEGTELLDFCEELADPPIIVMMTGYGSVESAVECMRKGAFDYIMKPFSLDEIDVVIQKAENFSQLVKVNRYFTKELSTSDEIIGNGPVIGELKTMVKKVASTDATVLITGENGTGKELIARQLHQSSARAGKPFIRVNCAAISETLIESEFFGHEKGAFTGALNKREGRFELADQGTILLDEISEIPMHLQAKLLRVLQEREFERVGGTKTIQVNVRVLATTNRDLKKEIAAGNFREDLYYRLNVFPINSPPLRERGEDIELLANAFLEQFSKKHNKAVKGFSKEAVVAIYGHKWPGNVRELQNTIERAVILAEEKKPIVPFMLGLGEEGGGELKSLEDIESDHIRKVWSHTQEDMQKAAKILGITEKALKAKIDTAGISAVKAKAVKSA